MPNVKPNIKKTTTVGVGVIIFKNGKILLGCRRGAHGAGEYAIPGGHLEYMESFEECLRREIREEVGIEIDDPQFIHVSNTAHYSPRHGVYLGFKADWLAGEVENMEPDRCDGWEWYDPDNLPDPLFKLTAVTLEALKSGQVYFDKE